MKNYIQIFASLIIILFTSNTKAQNNAKRETESVKNLTSFTSQNSLSTDELSHISKNIGGGTAAAGAVKDKNNLILQNTDREIYVLHNKSLNKYPLLYGYFAKKINNVDHQSQLAINTTGLKPDFSLSVNGPTFIGTFDANGVNGAIIAANKRNNFNLWVEKGVISEDFALASVPSWADFVFEKDYKLRPLSEVEKFINENKHLPDVPSAAELKENGASMATLMKNLTQKVEELTLYAIQQDKQIKALQSELETTKKSKKKK
ncbi:hypothetical protein D3C87_410940 [compost metagenome]